MLEMKPVRLLAEMNNEKAIIINTLINRNLTGFCYETIRPKYYSSILSKVKTTVFNSPSESF
jgi:hypothetical protein